MVLAADETVMQASASVGEAQAVTAAGSVQAQVAERPINCVLAIAAMAGCAPMLTKAVEQIWD